MKKEIFIHFAFLISFLIFVSVFKNYFSLVYWPLWVGGLVGTILPDVDHFIYILFLRPNELNSQRASSMIEKKSVLQTLEFLAETRYERTKIIFHTASFQLVFVLLAFWVLTSSGSIFGRGLVLAFLLHLVIDQAVDLNQMGNLSNWFKNFPVSVEARERLYWQGNILILLIFSFLL
jgi:hypothetical protein